LAEAQLAEARSGLATSQGDLVAAVEEFRNATGRAPGNLEATRSLPKIEANVDTAKAFALRRHPDLRAVQHQVSAAELSIRTAQAQQRPTISAQGSATLSSDLESSDYTSSASIGIVAGGPIYSGGLLSSAVRSAQAQRDATRGNLHTVLRNVEQSVGNAYAQLRAARASLAASEEQVRSARIAFEGIREEAKLGARTTLDVLDAEQSLLDAGASQIAAQTLLHNAAYAVLSSTGQLTARDLRLPVQLYDVTEYYNLVKDSPTARSKQGAQLDRVLKRLQKN